MPITVATHPSMVHHFVGHVRARPDRPCLWYHPPGQPAELMEKEVAVRTWRELARDAAHAAAALRSLGLAKGDRLAFLSPNRYEWIAVDLAVLSVGAVHVPVHNSLSGPQMRYQIVDAGAKVVLLSGEEQAAKLAACEPPPSDFEYAALDPVATKLAGAAPRQLFNLAPSPTDAEIDAWLDSAGREIAPDDVATILYTSGTTGEPKGVMLSHRNITSNAEAIVIGFGGAQEERRLNLLPFSHIFARTCDLYCWLVGGSEMALADAPQTAIENCAEFAPRILNAVPYFYERVMRKIVEVGMADEQGILQGVMGGNIHYCCSGGAPLPEHIAKFFNDRGMLLVSGYGLTETSPVITMNTPEVHKHGTSGRAIDGIEMRIADDGEILTRGPHVMLGYWNKPAETAEVLVDGWFHTGDLGTIDEEGYLRITGRKKEIIVTTGGKKVAPALLEAKLTADPLIRQACIVGEGRDYLAALIVPAPEALLAAVRAAGDDLPDDVPLPKLLAHPAARAAIYACIKRRLSDLSHYEQVCKFALLEREFDIPHGEMTLTMKARRAQIAKNFAAEIEQLYQ
ncbi:MAG: long-chain fatty acid--CoA ligase [Planctomycetes bacterium]|nr:long-chain fatty acid--CoA ligase [Planctomycetota bacterium]